MKGGCNGIEANKRIRRAGERLLARAQTQGQKENALRAMLARITDEGTKGATGIGLPSGNSAQRSNDQGELMFNQW